MRKESKKMKKIIAILLVAVMALSLAACGGTAKSGDVTYAIVCKDASNPYMLKMIEGFKKSCDAIGVKMITKSPESATVDGQIQIVNELIAQGVKGIAIAANDAAALENVISEAKKAGIIVVTLDSDTKGSQMFVNQAGVEQVAQVLVDSCFDMAGGEGEFASLSASSTATNQNACPTNAASFTVTPKISSSVVPLHIEMHKSLSRVTKYPDRSYFSVFWSFHR